MNANTRAPSMVVDDFWVRAERAPSSAPLATRRSGKWLLFVPNAFADDVWAKIYAATVAGELGYAAKAATSRPNARATNQGAKLICVYTYDSDDVADVSRVRAKLREMGFVAPLSYKTDAATRAGEYAAVGSRVSKYRE